MLDMVSRAEKKAGLHIEIVDVTPAIAASWLDKNSKNRKRNARFVSRFVRDMKNGDWQVTGDSIKFDRNHNLIDGQHRLTACIESGAAFKTLVVYGLQPGTRDVVDTGKPRTNADVLAMHGATNCIVLASALRLLINERNGDITKKTGTTHSELVEAFVKHPNIGLYIPQAGQLPRGVAPYVVGYVNYVGSTLLRGKKDRAVAMMEVLKSGRPNYPGGPIHAFRERVIRASNHREGILSSRAVHINTFKHCWNMFAEREKLTIVKIIKSDTPIDGLDLSKL